MPIIKPSGKQEKEQFRIKMDANTLEKVRQYCNWADVKKIDDFFQQAAEYILSKDRDWLNHAGKTISGDKMQGTPDAVND